MLNFTGETAQFYGKDMFIQIDWEKNGTTGYTKTELFTVTNSTDDKDINELNDNLESHQREQEGPLETTMSPGTDSTSSPSSLPSSSSEADGSSNDSSSNGGGGGGLSTGATAGIAVGAVLGALLIGALAWFFLRRHRRNQRAGDDYVTQQTYAVDKETHNRAADSPNSPYSDENHMQPVFLGNLDHDRDAAPTPPPAGVPRSSFGSHDRGNNSGAQTPQGMSRNVAHLVEDGMTADEIRRLEEEERQLDDEIERAARR
jgi:LPXTG-motif cell wall-anchored protein